MAGKKTIVGETAETYCRKHKNMATRTLAKKLHQAEPDLFPTVERARSHIRIIRGQYGDKRRKSTNGNGLETVAGDERRSSKSTDHPEYNKAKILIFDIETSPHMAYVWQCIKAYISPEQLLDHSKVLCWAAKWLGEEEVFFSRVQEIEDDCECVRQLLDLFNEADIVVAHNGRAFDIKTLNTRWMANGLLPPEPYKTVDTCKLAQSIFRFPRAKLDSIARYLNIGTKTAHQGFELWTGCLAGDKEAWALMEEYNIQDVLLLEEVYLKLRAWDKRHPNVTLDCDDVTRCTVCGSSAVEELLKTAKTGASRYPSFRCKSCGHVMRSRSREKPFLDASERLANVM